MARPALRDRLDTLVLTLPAASLLAVFVVAPALAVTGLAFFDWDPLRGGGRFIGFGNFGRMLADGDLQAATTHTIVYAVLTVPCTLGAGLLTALAIHAAPRWADLWRTAYFVPMASTLAASSVVWQWLFYPRTGPIDTTLGQLTGLSGWLQSPELALPAVALVGSWQAFPAVAIMFLAGLAGVPRVTIDAARLDGAGAWHRFVHVTWPALGPATIFAVVIASRDALRVFDQVRVMTNGGPVDSTVTLSFLMWRRGISYSDVGGASVVDLVLLGLVLLITLIQLRAVGRRWERAGVR